MSINVCAMNEGHARLHISW